jgi:hypothetical protein
MDEGIRLQATGRSAAGTTAAQSIADGVSWGPSLPSARASTKSYAGTSRVSIWIFALNRSVSNAFIIALGRLFRFQRRRRFHVKVRGIRPSRQTFPVLIDLAKRLEEEPMHPDIGCGEAAVRSERRSFYVRSVLVLLDRDHLVRQRLS